MAFKSCLTVASRWMAVRSVGYGSGEGRGRLDLVGFTWIALDSLGFQEICDIRAVYREVGAGREEGIFPYYQVGFLGLFCVFHFLKKLQKRLSTSRLVPIFWWVCFVIFLFAYPANLKSTRRGRGQWHTRDSVSRPRCCSRGLPRSRLRQATARQAYRRKIAVMHSVTEIQVFYGAHRLSNLTFHDPLGVWAPTFPVPPL